MSETERALELQDMLLFSRSRTVVIPEGGGGPMQQQQPPQQQQQQQQTNPALTDPAMAQVVNRFKMAKTDEEKQSAFQELKKTPHLFAAFIKMKPNSEVSANSIDDLVWVM